MNHATKIILKKGKERSVKRLHPWRWIGKLEQKKNLTHPAFHTNIYRCDNCGRYELIDGMPGL